MRRIISLANWIGFVVAIIAVTSRSWGAGGPCPSGANYLNPSNPAGAQITLATLGVTSCYFVAASGSDSNSGTSESSPWLHAPGMPGCTATCKSTTPAAGEGFIFRGGDTWHFGNSSPSDGNPYTGGAWSWTQEGTSSNPIYIGVDPSWYSGSSWARPILTWDNPTSTSAVSSCSYTGGYFIYFNPAQYQHFDNFEMTGVCDNGESPDYVEYLPPTGTKGFNPPWYIENNYAHGWTHTAYSGSVTPLEPTIFAGAGNRFGVVLQYNVVDGSDSDDTDMSITGSGAGDAYIVQYNIFRHFGGGNVPNDCHLFHDNIIEYVNNANGSSSYHVDAWMCYGEANDSNHGGDGTPNLFYNNIMRYIGTEYSQALSAILWLFPPSTDYIFNNVFHDINQGSNYFNLCQGSCSGSAVDVFNNTFTQGTSGGCILCNDSVGITIQSVNNHWVTSQGTSISDVVTSTSGVTDTTSLYQTPSAASSQGYTSANDYAPTASTNSTVTASGTNETSGYCAALQNSIAQTYCTEGTSGACSYNSTNHTVSCPRLTLVSRPSSGAWNVGAYQYGSSAAPAPPTDVTATPH